MRLIPLPRELRNAAFAVRDADVPAKRLRARDLNSEVWGARLATRAPLTWRDRCTLFAARLPAHILFSHATAALLLRAPLPLALERDPRIHVAVAAPASAPHARGLVGHRLSLAPGDVTCTGQLRHTSAARTWCDMAGILDLDDLIVLGDYLINHRAPLTSRVELGSMIERMPGARGMRRARAALALLSDRPESAQESRVRLLVLRSGLPEPTINHVIVDTETGREVRPDFRFKAVMLILEYQGYYHRTKAQWRKDMTRRSRLEAQGWTVMELNADDLDDSDELVGRIRLLMARLEASRPPNRPM
ncbi:MAG: hypothetical protein BGO97_05650 [Micrococcales bacterium 70-64]|nr:DUF559 domain-containing protein [Leifsonia sp.]ODU63564.1 MAG: hypothetical protein ABT06_05655 [Leifsonia sp. SCN 70-46]OJX85255.1 MAG: hypothetical protein BGO97_05650 [Micrococcales bacterium 70-64]